MDYKEIINLMREMNQTELTRLEIEEEGVRICLEKAHKPSESQCNSSQGQISYPVYAPAMSYPQTMAPASNPTGNTVPSVTAVSVSEGTLEDPCHKNLVSPMVGTFYAQPAPDKPPFVKVGDKVRKGQTICIIEAMKLMNEIESEHDGEIVKVLINSEEMVEFGQPLFLISVK